MTQADLGERIQQLNDLAGRDDGLVEVAPLR
jgi:hypothetical protein